MQFTVPFVERILLFFEPVKDKKSQSDVTAKDNPFTALAFIVVVVAFLAVVVSDGGIPHPL
jgi:hypothetical protein